jgi:hypothetical protein
MKYATLILALICVAASGPAFAQDNTRNGDNFRRDRGGDRRDFRRDRNGNGNFDNGRFDRTRTDRSSDQRSYDRPRETVAAPTPVTPVSAPAPTKVAEVKPEIEADAPVENVSTNSGPVDPRSYEAFRIIATRNIFDPNRFPGSGVTGPVRPVVAPKRTELFTLVGAISYDKGDYAFFDSNSSEYRKTVKPGDTIAGYKVAEVGADKVTLEADGKKVELPVGGQMKRQGDEEWKLNSRAEPIGSMGSSNSSSSATTSSESSSSGGDMPEALKRLLEQRKNEK